VKIYLTILRAAGPGSDRRNTGSARFKKQFLYFSTGSPSTTFTNSVEICRTEDT